MNPKKRKKPKSVRAVVSHSSILIISGFLIGISTGRTHEPALGTSLFLLGSFGIVSYIGLGYIARQRREKAAERKQQRAAKKLEVRMGRHIPRRPDDDRQPTTRRETAKADRRLVHSH